MKTAIYIEDGIVQLVITPESGFERNAMQSFHDKSLDVQIFDGSFYDCRGGWTRQASHRPGMHGVPSTDDKSLIMRVSDEKPKDKDRDAAFHAVINLCNSNIDAKTNCSGFATLVRDYLLREIL